MEPHRAEKAITVPARPAFFMRLRRHLQTRTGAPSPSKALPVVVNSGDDIEHPGPLHRAAMDFESTGIGKHQSPACMPGCDKDAHCRENLLKSPAFPTLPVRSCPRHVPLPVRSRHRPRLKASMLLIDDGIDAGNARFQHRLRILIDACSGTPSVLCQGEYFPSRKPLATI
ncbi:MAG: hypothetical protein FWD68_09880 [Alphaproteobacteria bacterium]|nr:hypothetical protein [Alphaproteobacteria bacterium]